MSERLDPEMLKLPCSCGGACECEAFVDLEEVDPGVLRVEIHRHNYFVDIDANAEAALLAWLTARAAQRGEDR